MLKYHAMKRPWFWVEIVCCLHVVVVSCCGIYSGIYNRLIINNDSQKHNYICKYNNLPTTCFGLIRPSSGWNTASEENYLFWSKCKWEGGDEISFTNMGIVAETVLAKGASAWWSVAPLGWFLWHGGLVSEIGLEWPLCVCCCGGSTPCW